jgi:predicted type IV restriction endonuclease
MALLDNIRRLSEQVRKRQPHTRGEEGTKNALILPFLGALGYDIFDPTEVQPEYIADFAKKRPGGPAEKVDYAIRLNGVPAMFFECKAADADPTYHGGQLSRYFNSTP